MRSSTDAARDCRFEEEAAIGEPGASEFRAVGGGDAAPGANADCRFPCPGKGADAPPHDTGAVGAPAGVDGRMLPPGAAGATSAGVAREGASHAAAAPRGSFPRFRRARRPCLVPSRTGAPGRKWTRPKAPGTGRSRKWKPGSRHMDAVKFPQQGSSRAARRRSSSLGAA
jgi:hypothetical protein